MFGTHPPQTSDQGLGKVTLGLLGAPYRTSFQRPGFMAQWLTLSKATVAIAADQFHRGEQNEEKTGQAAFRQNTAGYEIFGIRTLGCKNADEDSEKTFSTLAKSAVSIKKMVLAVGFSEQIS